MKRITLALIAGLTAAVVIAAPAQTLTSFKSAIGSKVTIDGTSNIHDWTVEGSVISGLMEVDKDALLKGAAGVVPCKVTVKIPVRSLKSGKDTMDTVMQDHMSMEKYPMIAYTLTELKVVKAGANGVECESKGSLVVSGTTNAITMPVTIAKAGDDGLKVDGKIDLKMTSYNIKPPQPALAMGMIKTGDDVKLALSWLVKEVKK